MPLIDPANVEDMRNRGDIEGLVGALDSHQPTRIRLAAVTALGRIVSQGAVQPLIASLGDPECCVRCAAAESLGRIGGKDACKALVAALGDKVGLVRQTVIESLRLIGDPDSDEALIAALKDGFIDVRLAAAAALGERRCEQAIRPLLILLLATESNERKAASQALIHFGALAVEPLIAALTHREWLIREYAASILGSIGDPQAIEPLIAALKDREAVVREFASRALGAIGSELEDAGLREHVRQSLITAAREDANPNVREVAHLAHQQLHAP